MAEAIAVAISVLWKQMMTDQGGLRLAVPPAGDGLFLGMPWMRVDLPRVGGCEIVLTVRESG